MVDYSKWKKIEVSDDEDETHPNIDTPSLFKWRHEARVEKMAEFKKKKDKIMDTLNKAEKELQDARKKLEGKTGKELDAAKKDTLKVEKKYKEALKAKNDLEKEERLAPHNVDTLSKDGFQRTILNKPRPRDTTMEDMSEDEREQKQRDYFKKNEKEIKQFGMLQKFDDSRRFLTEKPHLVHDWTTSYLIIWLLNLQMEEKTDLVKHIAHQVTCLNYILELGKQLEVDPRSCLSNFFARIQTADQVYKKAFDDELAGLIGRIEKRAHERLEAAMKEVEEEEKVKRLGPGGLDPQEVFETLPESLQKCFESRNIDLLKQTVAKMAPEDARYHMDRCISSGLWVPDANDMVKDEEGDGDGDADDGDKDEASTS